MSSPATTISPQLTGNKSVSVKTNSVDFAEALRSVENENEIIVWVKAEGQARPTASLFSSFTKSSATVALPPGTPGERIRRTLAVREDAGSAKGTLTEFLREAGVEPYGSPDGLPVLFIRVPDTQLETLVSKLMNHPNVDWMEVNERHPVKPLAGPSGSNPTDSKHTLHYVAGAWDHTRGSGAAVGILDSGYAGDESTSTWHPDGLDLGTSGIVKLGFVDDGGSCDALEKSQGLCLAYDDHGHGSVMAGLAGENDNSIGHVGIAPEALVYSLKIAFNADRSGLTCGIFPWGDDRFCLEADDWMAGVNWARSNGVGVLSMSFVSDDVSPSVRTVLNYAYYSSDVLLLAGLGNSPGDGTALLEIPAVMGVGGLLNDSVLGKEINLSYFSVGGAYHGTSTVAHCQSQTDICTFALDSLYASNGGTSVATANVAAIAALVRAANPTLTAPQVRTRLTSTSSGVQWRLADAEWAVENVSGVRALVSGPDDIWTQGWNSWQSNPTGGLGGYTYHWEQKYQGNDWFSVGYTQNLSLYVSEGYPDFELRVTVTSQGRKGRDDHDVRNQIGCEEGEEDCENW